MSEGTTANAPGKSSSRRKPRWLPKGLWPARSAPSIAAPQSLEVPDLQATLSPAVSLPISTPLALEALHTPIEVPATSDRPTTSDISAALLNPTTLQGPSAVFVTEGASDNAVVNNVYGDQNFVYEANATPPAPHALDLLRILDPIPMNAVSRPQCLKGTRERILQSLSDHLTAPSAAAKVLWLHGMAGSGKSTIATTIAEHFHKCSQRGAFLFFDRNSPAQSGPDGVMRTLAHQLALSNDILRNAICDAIEQDPQIATTTLTSQFNNLIMTPLHSCAPKITGPIVIILDAFDECGDAQSRKALLHLLIKHLPTLPHQFRFLITGRPELDLNNAFCAQPRIISVSLGSSEWSGTTDVLRYIEHEIDELYQARRGSDELPLDWPGKPKVQDIGARAADSFIWAATAIRFLDAADDVDERLQMLLSQNTLTLGDLYATALRSAGNWDPREQSTAYCRKILGAVVVGRIALTDDMIIDILGLENAKSCRLVLRRLSCLLQWSEGVPIRTLHASFADYLTDAGSCGDQPWFIDKAGDHVDFTTGCLRVMKRFLRFNICGLETSHLMNHDVPDLVQRIEDCIPRSLAYACRFWAEHLSRARPDDPHLAPLILEFFQNIFLYWLEVLSLIDEAHAALQAMLDVGAFSKSDIHVQAFAQDGIKFTRAFMSIILESAPHIYVSALPFTPSTSIIRQQYSRIMGNTLCLPASRRSDWPSCEQAIYVGLGRAVYSIAFSPDGDRVASSVTSIILVWNVHTGELVAGPFEGHKGFVDSIAFSPDGARIASGSRDHTVRVWDAHTGELVSPPFEGHTDRVNSVAFSSDGERIASGSNDTTIRVWDVQGQLVSGPFKKHTNIVSSVAFSPNGLLIVSGSWDGTVCLWDARTGKLVARTSEGDGDMVYSVAFSPDGEHMASGSTDWCIYVWRVRSGELVTVPFEGHSAIVTSVAFSPDGMYIASGSYDQTVRVWDVQTGQLVAGPFEDHSSFVTSVAYSPDGLHIASGSYDHTICIWSTRIGELLAGPDELHIALGSQDNNVCGSQMRTSALTAAPRDGHGDAVLSVAFSPDGKYIASGSRDTTICVWDAHTGELVAGPFEGHTYWATSVAFSPDGECIASGSADDTLRVWDTNTGELVAGPFEAHTASVNSIAFSPDGQCIASGSDDHTVRVWNSRSGTLVAGPFEGHKDQVKSVAFSPDGEHIASGSHDCTIRIWDSKTGHLVAGPLDGHRDRVTSVAFSPDGLHIASGSYDQTIRVWDANTGQLVSGPFEEHINIVCSVAFSPDGLHIVSGAFDSWVWVWDFRKSDGLAGRLVSRSLSSSSIPAPFGGHTGFVNSVAFSPNGEYIVSGSDDRTIQIFDMRAGASSGSVQGFNSGSWLLDGWMQNSPTELLFWVPPAYRTGLWRPNSTLVIGRRTTKLDMTRFVHGKDWARCHI
ncbi:WD40 repeat-like protein [Athelia psychrophila]|uniref:WD40 repeat-like protein n=1 Tax=Athelia psychrophila TaxID=1759441 RepID=A0A165XHG4_9AGAM|nr:WD40 repeat-like protein [Fibularhizoctonia sp. CBS 109695]